MKGEVNLAPDNPSEIHFRFSHGVCFALTMNEEDIQAVVYCTNF
jgi:hypothetical protein